MCKNRVDLEYFNGICLSKELVLDNGESLTLVKPMRWFSSI